MDYSTLATELQQPQYSGMTDAEIVAALNALSQPTRRRVPIADLQARAMETGVYTTLRVVVGNAQAPAELRAVAQTVLDLSNARFADVDLDNASARQMFGALQAAGVISQQQAAAIDALATVPGVSRAQEWGLGSVAEADVVRSRLWGEFDTLRSRWAGVYNAGVGYMDAAFGRDETLTWDDLLAEVL